MEGTHIPGAGPAQPAEPDGDHAAVEAVIGLRDSSVRHVEVMVFKHQGSLRFEKILNTRATLGKKLRVACNFRRVHVDSGVNRAGPCVEVGNNLTKWFESKAHHQGGADEAPAGMRGPTQHLLADQLETFQGKP